MPRATIDLSLSDPRDLRFEPLNILWGGPLIVDRKRKQRQREERVRRLHAQQDAQQQQLQLQQAQQPEAPPPPPVEAPVGSPPLAIVSLDNTVVTLDSANIQLNFKNSAEKLAVVPVAAEEPAKQLEDAEAEKKKNAEVGSKTKKSPKAKKKARFEKTGAEHRPRPVDDSEDSGIESEVARLAQKLYKTGLHHRVSLQGAKDKGSDDGEGCSTCRSSTDSEGNAAPPRRGRVRTRERHRSSMRCSSCGRLCHVYSDVNDDGHGNREFSVHAIHRRRTHRRHGDKGGNDGDNAENRPALPASGDDQAAQPPNNTNNDGQANNDAASPAMLPAPGGNYPRPDDPSFPQNNAFYPPFGSFQPYPMPYNPQNPYERHPSGFLSFTYPYPPAPEGPPLTAPQAAYPYPYPPANYAPPHPHYVPQSPASYASPPPPWAIEGGYPDTSPRARHRSGRDYDRAHHDGLAGPPRGYGAPYQETNPDNRGWTDSRLYNNRSRNHGQREGNGGNRRASHDASGKNRQCSEAHENVVGANEKKGEKNKKENGKNESSWGNNANDGGNDAWDKAQASNNTATWGDNEKSNDSGKDNWAWGSSNANNGETDKADKPGAWNTWGSQQSNNQGSNKGSAEGSPNGGVNNNENWGWGNASEDKAKDDGWNWGSSNSGGGDGKADA